MTELLYNALIIDDEPDILELLDITLQRMGLNTLLAENIKQAKDILKTRKVHLCLSDLKLPDGDGLELVDYIQKHHDQIPVAIISAHGTMDSAIHALKKGAFDFVSKPVDLKQLRSLVQSAMNEVELSNVIPGHQDDENQTSLIGQSESFQQLIQTIQKLARSQAPVFICGESGSGKELVARQIHLQSSRREKPFIAVNCGAIPSELMESEFFGHKKGSFTGATSDKEGFFQAADGGTLFLDEIADLPLNMQVKLLRAIQEKSVRPVGGQKEEPVDIRLLSASHKDLEQELAEQNFRQDLYYRINVIQLDVPSLHERAEDIPLLARHYLKRLAVAYEVSPIQISSDAMDTLSKYSFPGNIREMENILERAFALCENQTIQADDLGIKIHKADSNQAPQGEAPRFVPGTSLEDYLEEIEREVITQALEENRWNKTATAKALGITFRALRYRLKKLDLE